MLIYLLAIPFLVNACYATEIFAERNSHWVLSPNSSTKPYSREVNEENYRQVEKSNPCIPVFLEEDLPEKNAREVAEKKNIQEEQITKALNRRKEILQTQKELADVEFHITPKGFLVFHNGL